MNKELKPCPFCGEPERIKYSIKRTGRFEVQYHATMYCDRCHTYGPRVLTSKIKNNDYKGRTAVENDPEIRKQAEAAWNRRTPDIDEVVKQLDKCANEEIHLWASDEEDYENGKLIIRKTTDLHRYGAECFDRAIEIVKGGGA